MAFNEALLALGNNRSAGAASRSVLSYWGLFISGLLVPVLSFCLPFYALIHYVFTLRDSVINYHFILLLVLTVYLVVDGLRQLQGPERARIAA
ncbi:MAG: hypothetical protein IPM93_24780 [Candidatus Obscuribacter sp.]|nr:hypothetical protein [Candidatus Obscuribacter sp.]